MGSDRDIFSLPYVKWRPLATEYLAASFWDFLHKFHIKFVTNIQQPPPLLNSDPAIMDLLHRHGTSAPVFRSINKCRIFLKLFRLSDLLSCCGRSLRPELAQHIPNPRLAQPRAPGPKRLGHLGFGHQHDARPQSSTTDDQHPSSITPSSMDAVGMVPD